jgi:trk system potassium uptake protein TrkH
MDRKNQVVSGYRLILGYIGLFLVLIGIITLLPLITIVFYPEEITIAKNFIIPGVISILLGFLLNKFTYGKEKHRLEKHQDVLLILFVWMIAIVVSAMPLIISGDYNFSQAIFESTSGYSTTGLSVVDVENTTQTLLMFRSLMQFFGGVGLVLVLTSAVSDKHGMRLYAAEGHNDKLVPNLIRSARLILSIYIGYILVGSIGYVIFGMTPFDAFNHAIASVSTGGFSTRTMSIGYYQSLGIEIITIILMLLGSTNLIIHLLLFKAKFKKAFNHVELKLLLVLSIIFIPMMIIFISKTTQTIDSSFRVGLFQFISAITTTGFSNVDSFSGLPQFFNLSVIILMIIGGGIGSTAGGLKQYRVSLAIKNFFWNLRNRISDEKTIHTNYITRFGKEVIIESEDIHSNNAHIFIYMLTLVIGTLIFASYGYTVEESLFEFASALGTVGLSIGLITPESPNIILWTTSVGMLLGRLEFYVVFIAITKLFLDIKDKKVQLND